MPKIATIAELKRFNDLVNFHIGVQVEMFVGQTDRFQYVEADIEVIKTANPPRWGSSNAATYVYAIDCPSFTVTLRAVYPEPDDATAAVSVLSITPEIAAAREACDAWVSTVLDAKVPPRDLFDEMLARTPITEADLRGLPL